MLVALCSHSGHLGLPAGRWEFGFLIAEPPWTTLAHKRCEAGTPPHLSPPLPFPSPLSPAARLPGRRPRCTTEAGDGQVVSVASGKVRCAGSTLVREHRHPPSVVEAGAQGSGSLGGGRAAFSELWARPGPPWGKARLGLPPPAASSPSFSLSSASPSSLLPPPLPRPLWRHRYGCHTMRRLCSQPHCSPGTWRRPDSMNNRTPSQGPAGSNLSLGGWPGGLLWGFV